MCGGSAAYRTGTADRLTLTCSTVWEVCLRHRGPDDEGVYASGETGLAHTRLSIIDLTADGRQPMRSDDGRFAITYNGEVYNFPALRRSLEEAGHRFRGRSGYGGCPSRVHGVGRAGIPYVRGDVCNGGLG